MQRPSDNRSLADVSADLARRWATQRLAAVQAYGRILADFGSGRSTGATAASAYAKLVAEESVRYSTDAFGIASDFAAAVVRSAGGQASPAGPVQSPIQDLEMSGPLGGTASAEFLLRNPHGYPATLSFVTGAFASSTGPTNATVTVEPSGFVLEPGCEQTITVSAALNRKIFSAGERYVANVAITGFDDLVVRVHLTVLPS